MTTTRTWYHRLSQWWPKSDKPVESNGTAPAKNPGVVVGCFNHRGHWYLCSPTLEMKGRTIYAITLGQKQVDQYYESLTEYTSIQRTISEAPKSLRRRKPAAKMSIPDLNENTESVQ